jgi:hypothetical protein
MMISKLVSAIYVLVKIGVRGTLGHDPEKWKPVFRKDHASANIESRNRFQFETIAL